MPAIVHRFRIRCSQGNQRSDLCRCYSSSRLKTFRPRKPGRSHRRALSAQVPLLHCRCLGDRFPRFLMKILHATDFHNRANSGITFAVNELASQTLARLSPEGSVTLLSIGETDIAVDPGVRHVKARPSTDITRLWRFAPSYSAVCDEAIRGEKAAIVHIHGIWMYPQFAAARCAHRRNVPTILTNHGAIQWAIRQPRILGGAKKRFYIGLMKGRLLRKVTVQHAITNLDRDALYSLLPHPRIEVIPNFVDLQKVDHWLAVPSPPAQRGEPYVLCFGRLHPTKGVDILIEAFGLAALPRDWRLIIVGPSVDLLYQKKLRRLIADSPRGDRIEMRDAVWDLGEKYALMRDAWVTVVPSHTEVISLVNLESSACFTPTITTKATGLHDWTEGGGLLIEAERSQLAAALSDAARWSTLERAQRGAASRELIQRRYSATAVMPRWLDLYRSLS
jgi:glycosyltransferase involved in cell wall biosynthesis